MKCKRHSPEQIIRKLRDADQRLSEGKEIAAVCQALAVCESTFHRWRNQYGGMKANLAKRTTEKAIFHALIKEDGVFFRGDYVPFTAVAMS